MVNDQQVKRLWRLAGQKWTLEIAAAKAGMDPKTARKYLRERLPLADPPCNPIGPPWSGSFNLGDKSKALTSFYAAGRIKIKCMTAQWMILLVYALDQPGDNAGVLLWDSTSSRLHVKLKPPNPKWGEDTSLVWESLSGDLVQLSLDLSADEVVKWLEENSSSTIRVSERHTAEIGDIEQALQELFDEHVRDKLAAAKSMN